MTFIPDELKERSGLTLAPMIDFLFLMLAVFASFAVTRIALHDTDIELVQSKKENGNTVTMNEFKTIQITISKEGSYHWVTEVRDYPMETADAIEEELLKQYQKGLLPDDKLKTQILLKIDKETPWEPVLQVLLAIQSAGFEARPVYEKT